MYGRLALWGAGLAGSAGWMKKLNADLKPACLNCPNCQMWPDSNFLAVWALLITGVPTHGSTKPSTLIIEGDEPGVAQWHIGGSASAHRGMKSHAGILMAAGEGALHAASKKQKLEAKSSAEAELIAVGGVPSQVLWAKCFLKAQGHTLGSTTLYQDDQSATLLEQNGEALSTKRVRHINIRCFCMTDVANEQKLLDTQHLPSDSMQGD